MKRFIPFTLQFFSAFVLLFAFGCEPGAMHPEESPDTDAAATAPLEAHPVTDSTADTTMAYTATHVKEVRAQTGIDERAMALEGVLSVGTSGASNDDAWIQILVKDDSAAENARRVLGDTLEGVPIKYALSDTIRAQ